MYHNLPLLSVFFALCVCPLFFTMISSDQLILPQDTFKTQITHP